jgi:hypothetical protein
VRRWLGYAEDGCQSDEEGCRMKIRHYFRFHGSRISLGEVEPDICLCRHTLPCIPSTVKHDRKRRALSLRTEGVLPLVGLVTGRVARNSVAEYTLSPVLV